jgi:hypothetical protein
MINQINEMTLIELLEKDQALVFDIMRQNTYIDSLTTWNDYAESQQREYNSLIKQHNEVLNNTMRLKNLSKTLNNLN